MPGQGEGQAAVYFHVLSCIFMFRNQSCGHQAGQDPQVWRRERGRTVKHHLLELHTGDAGPTFWTRPARKSLCGSRTRRGHLSVPWTHPTGPHAEGFLTGDSSAAWFAKKKPACVLVPHLCCAPNFFVFLTEDTTCSSSWPRASVCSASFACTVS